MLVYLNHPLGRVVLTGIRFAPERGAIVVFDEVVAISDRRTRCTLTAKKDGLNARHFLSEYVADLIDERLVVEIGVFNLGKLFEELSLLFRERLWSDKGYRYE